MRKVLDRDRHRDRHIQRYKRIDQGVQHKIERADTGAIRCVIHPSRLDESLSREKKQRSWRLEFGRVGCEMAIISFLFLIRYSSQASPHPLMKVIEKWN